MPQYLVRQFAAAIIILVGLLAASPAFSESGIKINDAWVRMAPPTVKIHGGYLTIVNETGETQELVDAYSEGYESIEIHISRVEHGIAKMQRLESLKIPAGGKAEFKPGGMHLMLLGAKKPLEHGALIPIRLGFRKGIKLEFEAIVINNGPDGSAPPDDMMKMDHSGHGGRAH